MNVTEAQQVDDVLCAVFANHDPDAALQTARALAERTRKVLLHAGLPCVRPDQLTSHSLAGVFDAADDGPRCLHCGCTDEQACPGGCVWVPGPMDGDLCSRCAYELALIAAALDDAAGYRDLRSSARCEACISSGDGRCAEHQADEDHAARYRELLAGRYSTYLPKAETPQLRPGRRAGQSKPSAAAAVLPPGCDMSGCLHHYPQRPPGCICPSWFDNAGWHLIEVNPACNAHTVRPGPGTRILPPAGSGHPA